METEVLYRLSKRPQGHEDSAEQTDPTANMHLFDSSTRFEKKLLH